MAENATHNLHNLLTLRGALVRDPHVWAALPHRGDRRCSPTAPTSSFASHHWPTWGTRADRRVPVRSSATCTPTCTTRRCGCSTRATPAPRSPRLIELPPALEQAWHTHGYYGSVSHNVKAVYQRYMGWFDGNPARLWQHPPEAIGPALRRRRWAASTGSSNSPRRPSTTAISAGRQRFSTTRSSPTRTTPAARAAVRRHPRTARLRRRERRPGATSSSPAPPNCGTATSAPRRDRRRRRCWLSSPRSRCSTRWRSASTGHAPGTSTSRSTSRSWTPPPTTG